MADPENSHCKAPSFRGDAPVLNPQPPKVFLPIIPQKSPQRFKNTMKTIVKKAMQTVPVWRKGGPGSWGQMLSRPALEVLVPTGS